MLKKRWSICQIRWDTIVIFISQSTKTLQLKKGLNFNMQKNYFTVETICWLQWLRHGTVYVFWLQNYIYNLLNFLKPRTLIPSKHCTVFFGNRKKNIFPQNTIETRKEDTWSQVTIHKKWLPVSVVKRLVFTVCMNTQFFTFYFNCLTK